jgi:outer membrane biosynthesis protein TonB
MRPWCAYALAGATLLSVPAAIAQAQSPDKAQQDAIRSNCRSDFMRNCSSVPRGGREALDCLMQNKAKVSAGCQGALNAVAAPAAAKPEPKPEPKAAAPRPEPAPTAAAPAAPAHAAPAHAAPPPPRTPAAAAPTEPRAKPKPAPKAVATPARPAPPVVPQAAAPAAIPVAPPPAAAPQQPRLGEAILIRRFCTTDFKVLCKGVPLGQGRAIQCLANNGPALSPGCREAMMQTGELR